jgi:putative transposase
VHPRWRKPGWSASSRNQARDDDARARPRRRQPRPDCGGHRQVGMRTVGWRGGSPRPVGIAVVARLSLPGRDHHHCAVWLYYRFSRSLRDVGELLAERGLTVRYETIGAWCAKFGPSCCGRNVRTACARRSRGRAAGDDHRKTSELSASGSAGATQLGAPTAQGAQQSSGEFTPADAST